MTNANSILRSPALRLTPRVRSRTPRSGFTLLESLMACGILLITVMAVTSAITAGQQYAMEAQLKVAASMAADDLMGRLAIAPAQELSSWHGFREDPGAMLTSTGETFPPHFNRIGREITVTADSLYLEDLDVTVSGRRINVRVFDSGGRNLIVLERFLPSGGGG